MLPTFTLIFSFKNTTSKITVLLQHYVYENSFTSIAQIPTSPPHTPSRWDVLVTWVSHQQLVVSLFGDDDLLIEFFNIVYLVPPSSPEMLSLDCYKKNSVFHNAN